MNLIFHLGAGKTGSSSIQAVLRRNREFLLKEGFFYSGLMFEFLENKLYPEYMGEKILRQFHKLSLEEGEKILQNLLLEAVKEAESHSCHTVIWSHESFLGKKTIFSPLKYLLEKGIIKDLKLVIYVRNFASLLVSSYVQWGLIDKTYNGKVRNFKEFVKVQKSSFFIEQLSDHGFGKYLLVRNYDTKKNVVEDFFTIIGFQLGKLKYLNKKANLSPSMEELFLHVMYNSLHEESVTFWDFFEIFGKLENKTPTAYMENLLPSLDDVEEILLEYEAKEKAVNTYLRKSGEDILQNKIKEISPMVESEKLLFSLSEIVMKQSKKISELAKEIDILKEKNA